MPDFLTEQILRFVISEPAFSTDFVLFSEIVDVVHFVAR